MRVVQTGFGDPRPLVLVFHLSEHVDAALRAAAGPNALIANETVSGSTYNNISSLEQIKADLTKQTGARFAPIVVAGFSAGGFATRRILELGGDPDALVVADGTYATDPSDWAAWQAYAERAKKRERAFIASHTSLVVPSSTWHVLQAISNFDLPLGANVTNRPAGVPVLPEPGPVRNEAGNFVIYSYPTENKAGHEYQGDQVLPMMLSEALSRVSTPRKSLLPAVVVTLGLAAVGGLAYMLLRHDKGATKVFA